MDERQTVAEALKALLAEGGPWRHPECEILAAYQDGQLPSAQAAEVRDHLDRCPDCAALERELADFRPLEARSGTASAWSRLRVRLVELAGPVLALALGGGSARRPQAAQLAWAAGALAALGLGLTGGWLLQRHAERSALWPDVPIVTLHAVRHLETEVAPGTALIVIPARNPLDITYQAELIHGEDTIWSGRLRAQTAGTFRLRLPRDLEPGTHLRLRIRGRWDPEGDALEEFALAVVETADDAPAQP